MKKIIEMLLPLMLLAVTYLTLVKCNKKWLTYLNDTKELKTLAFLGTHDTASYGTTLSYAQTQSIGITAQLEAGIRVFDMRVRRTNNVFAMHHDLIYLGMMFGDIVREVRNYLHKNPKEFVIMLMQEEYTAESSTMSECEILEKKYVKDWPNIFFQNWSLVDTIGELRGKILLARGNRGFWMCTKLLVCKEQNHYELNSQYGKAEKSNAIRALQAEVSAKHHIYRCYINYLSANGGALYNPLGIALDRWEPPRSSVNGPITTQPGMNDLMVSIFRNPRKVLYIVMADFPSQRLIDKVVDSNHWDRISPSYY